MEENFLNDQENEKIKAEDLKLIKKWLKTTNFAELSQLLKKQILPKVEPNTNLDQILLSIYVFTLLKLQNFDQISEIFNRLKIEEQNIIFPLKFLEAKYYFMIVI